MKKRIAIHQLHYIYLLLAPAFLLVCVFAYFPAANGIYHSFFRWNGNDICEYVGFENFRRIWGDAALLRSFSVLIILVVANLFKMIPPILAAVCIHRLLSERWRYYYRVAFVIPMIVPGMVLLLLWKFFYDPNVGVLNHALRSTGLMGALQWLDQAAPGASALLIPVREALADAPFGSVWGMLLLGLALLCVRRGWQSVRGNWFWCALILAAGWFAWGPAREIAAVAAVAGLCHALPRSDRLQRITAWLGGGLLIGGGLLVLLTMVWPTPTQAFALGKPAWLGHTKLILPSVIFYGFPWVGIIGVLIYLAGLGNISEDIYEAADLDGVNWFQKFLHIELPLIMTQVRLNLVLMIISTIKQFGNILILLDYEGGPGSAALVPGLYMYSKAFKAGEAGYASAIGIVLFFLVLALTMINQKFVRVNK